MSDQIYEWNPGRFIVTSEAMAAHLAAKDATIASLEEQATLSAAKIARLEAERSHFDCRFAGSLAETSGSHCPIDDPCDRCRHEREVRRLEAEKASLSAALDKAEEVTKRATVDACWKIICAHGATNVGYWDMMHAVGLMGDGPSRWDRAASAKAGEVGG